MTEKQVRTQVRVQWIFIVLLIAAGIFLYTKYQTYKIPRGGAAMIEPIDDKNAKNNVKKFRNITFWTKKGNGAWYDVEELKFYADSIFPKLVAAQRKYMEVHKPSEHNPSVDTTLYEWKVGFYWMLTEDSIDGKTKPDFCVVPIFVKKGTLRSGRKDIIDYFDPRYENFYNRMPRIRVIRNSQGKLQVETHEDYEGNAYNTGTMFP